MTRARKLISLVTPQRSHLVYLCSKFKIDRPETQLLSLGNSVLDHRYLAYRPQGFPKNHHGRLTQYQPVISGTDEAASHRSLDNRIFRDFRGYPLCAKYDRHGPLVPAYG